jgi:hypothetical protein
MDLKCSTYGPEHKTERFRSFGVFVNVWKPVKIGKNCVFLYKQQFVCRDILLKKSLNIQVFMLYISSKGSKQKIYCKC